jgi:hypothetical protein
MKNKITFILSCSIFFIANFAIAAAEITVYKSATCGCCKKWISHLEQNGFKVSAFDVKDVVPYKIKNKITPQLASCHTAFVDGYAIEGHVPASDIKRLLTEKPDIHGLTAPGMPMGSPGMEIGDNFNAYDIILMNKDGSSEVYASIKSKADQ